MIKRAELSRLKRRSMVHFFFKTLIGMMILAFAVTALILDYDNHARAQSHISAGMQMMLEMTTRVP